MTDPAPEEPPLNLKWHYAMIDRQFRRSVEANERLSRQPDPWVYVVSGGVVGVLLMVAGGLFAKVLL